MQIICTVIWYKVFQYISNNLYTIIWFQVFWAGLCFQIIILCKRLKFQVIIIMSYNQHGYPWPSLATSPYHSSPPAGLQGYILCLHIAAVCRFELVVLLLLGHMWGSIGVHHLRPHPCFSSSVLRVWFF